MENEKLFLLTPPFGPSFHFPSTHAQAEEAVHIRFFSPSLTSHWTVYIAAAFLKLPLTTTMMMMMLEKEKFS